MYPALLLLLAGLAGPPTLASEIDGPSALIVAEALAARFVSTEDDASPSKVPGAIYFGAFYDVEVRVKTVLAGNFDQKRLTVRLLASNTGHILPGKTLVIALDEKGGRWVVRAWEPPMEIVCLPADVVEEFKIEELFDGSINYGQEQCTSL
jgi:hypothetical protein